MPATDTTTATFTEAQGRRWAAECLRRAATAYRVLRAWRDDAPTLPAFRRRAAAVTAAAVLTPAAALLGFLWAASECADIGLHLLRWLYNSPGGHAVRALAETVRRPASDWLHQHAAHLPASPTQLGWAWLGLASLLYLSARWGNLAGRFAFTALAAGTTAAAWQAGAQGDRAAVVAVTAGAWLLLAPSAYARTAKDPLRQELHITAQQTVTTYTVVDPASSVPYWGVAEAEEAAATEAASPVRGFACRYCSAPVVWDGPAEGVRTWRLAADGSTYCRQAPEPDTELNIATRGHVAL
ncbi:hypothetical protein ACFV1L_22065 [Kitasatospora sp. NPDC059646]|uniref:hypothetical protein n=1 Tax=Kitasatospora sp. NPDC059646 TaxID=3346893 RepID=UPI00367F914F